MLKLRESNEKMKEVVNEFKDLFAKELVGGGAFEYMDETSIKALQLSMKAINTSVEMMDAYVDCIEEQNKKLDMLLEKMNKLS